MKYQEYILAPSLLRTTTGNGIDVETFDPRPISGVQGEYNLDARVYLDVTALNSATALDVWIQALIGGAYINILQFDQISGAIGISNQSLNIKNCPHIVRARWNITGTSYTFAVAISR